MISSQDARLVYRNARAALKKQGVDISKAILSQSYLRFETMLDVNQTSFDFNVLVNQQNAGAAQYDTEIRLNLQDSFYISHLGFAILPAQSNGGDTSLASTLMTFPSALLDGSWNVYKMLKVWQGHLSLTVNNRVLCPAWDLYKHLKVPETQFPEWFGNPQAFYNMLDQNSGAEDGFYPVEPNWVLIGSKNNELKMRLPSSLGTAQGPNAKTRAVVIVRGVLAQNSTSVH